MIQVPTSFSSVIIQLLPNVYTFGQRVGLTLGKYYLYFLLVVTTNDISLHSNSNNINSSSSSSSDDDDSTLTNDTSTECYSNVDTIQQECNLNNISLQQQQQQQLLSLLPIINLQQIYTMIIQFPVWYSEWWWNLVQNDPIHVFVETILLLSIFYFLVSRRGIKSYKENNSNNNTIDQLTKQEEDELIDQWIRHERHPLTPCTTTTTTNGNNSSSSRSNNATSSNGNNNNNHNNEYRPTYIIHKSSGRYMYVEEVQHPSSNTISPTAMNKCDNNNNNTSSLPNSSTLLLLNPTAEDANDETTTTTIGGGGGNIETPIGTISDGSLLHNTPSSSSSSTVPFGINNVILKVLNFATMDFLGMSADTVPKSINDDDDDDDDDDKNAYNTGTMVDQNDGTRVLPIVQSNTKSSKRSPVTVSTITTSKQPVTTTITNDVSDHRLTTLHPVKVASLQALDRYGCGSCGPRGFYGTIDVHLHIERNIANFLYTDDAILYSDGASTVTSTIAAFCKRGDIIIVDEAVYEPIRTGVQLSRANIKWFLHNDMNDLRRILVSIQQNDKKRGRKSNAQRRFIVVEGLYKNTGTICPLDELIKLKHEFSCRLILDESFSFGTLGSTGRGVTELYQKKVMYDVEITCVSLENAMGSIGGLTTGIEEVVDHQRLSGSGYCYSASSPPFTASAALAALQLLQTRPDVTIQRLNRNLMYLHQQLQILLHDKLEDLLIVTSDIRSPIILLQVADIPETEYLDEVVFLQEVVRESFIRGVAFVATATGTSAVVPETMTTVKGGNSSAETGNITSAGFVIDLPSSIRMTVSAVHTLADIDCAIRVLGESVDVVMSRFYDEETTM